MDYSAEFNIMKKQPESTPLLSGNHGNSQIIEKWNTISYDHLHPERTWHLQKNKIFKI